MKELNDLQKLFIQKASNLRDSVINFQVSDEEFLDDYGYSKEEVQQAIDDLNELIEN